MNDMEKVMTIGVLKGIHSQTSDTDVKYALEGCIDILGKMLNGYSLVQQPYEDPMKDPNVPEEPKKAPVEAVQMEDDPMDYTE